MPFDRMVTGHVRSRNPAAPVRGPKHVVKRGKTPALTAAGARALPDSIPTKPGPQPEEGQEYARPHDLIGLRDRALIVVMICPRAAAGWPQPARQAPRARAG